MTKNETERAGRGQRAGAEAAQAAESGRQALVTARVEVPSFAGGPHVRAAVALVKQVARYTAVEVDLRLVDVPDAAAAVERRFLGSPTVRVEGRDVEPGSDDRDDLALACRVYQAPEDTRPTEARMARGGAACG